MNLLLWDLLALPSGCCGSCRSGDAESSLNPPGSGRAAPPCSAQTLRKAKLKGKLPGAAGPDLQQKPRDNSVIPAAPPQGSGLSAAV